jgi:lipopolysaccharide export system permease protein
VRELQKLYLKEFIILFIATSLILSVLFSLISVIENIDELLPLDLDAGEFIVVGMAKIPHFLAYLLPMAALLCCIFVISLASRRHEITIVKASGESLRKFFIPFLIVALVLTFIDFFIAEIVSPLSFRTANRILKNSGKWNGISYKEGSIWFKGKEGTIVKTKLFIPEKQELLGVSVLFIKNGGLQRRIEAERGSWTDTGWKLQKVRIYDLVAGKVSSLDEYLVTGIGEPEILDKEEEILSEMGVFELIRYERTLEEAGYRNVNLNVDIQSKLAYPLTNLFMVLIGVFLSLRSHRGRGILSAGSGILLCLIYWFFFTVVLSSGYAGVIPPTVSAWTVPVVSTVFALLLYLKIPV